MAIFSIVVFISCQKDFPQNFKDHDRKFGRSIVFVAGYESDGINTVPKCWINDQELTLPAGTNGAQANSIFVAGNDAYIAGNDEGPVYWKNTTEIDLPVQSSTDKIYSYANSIYVSGGHVYVAGQDGAKAVYWIDGTEIILNTTDVYGDFSYSIANSVFVSGNDIYVAGAHGPNAVYWKNGVETYITQLNAVDYNYMSESARSIYVSGGNVYVVGFSTAVGALSTIGTYWKNGMNEIATLDHSNFEYVSDANAVFVSGNKVYICGTGINNSQTFFLGAVYWINGNESILSGNGIEAFASDIYVKGNDVYVSGYENNTDNSQTYAVYWKNSTAVKLTNGTRRAFATSIFIK